MAGSERAAYVWQSLAPRLLHPLKVSIIEAMLWVDEPISSSKLARMLEDDAHYLGSLSHHMGTLLDAGVVERSAKEPVRGAVEHFYSLATPE